MAEVTRHAKTTALLLEDLQNELIKGSRPIVPLGGAQLIATCQRLLAKARAVGMAVVYVRVSRRPDLKDAPRPPWARRPAGLGHPASLKARRGRRSSRS
jgi:nicotinamidase-related amidase